LCRRFNNAVVRFAAIAMMRGNVLHYSGHVVVRFALPGATTQQGTVT